MIVQFSSVSDTTYFLSESIAESRVEGSVIMSSLHLDSGRQLK
jgi:hypothetical protein